MDIAKNIKRIREQYQLTQEDLGKIAGVSNKAVWAWENGTAVPRMGAIQRIADRFGLPKSVIIDRDIDEYNTLSVAEASLLAAFCGLRRGEIVALTSDDVYDNVIHVRSAAVRMDGKTTVRQPKTYTSDRYTPIPPFVARHIENIEGRICPIELNSITRRFEELRDKLGYKCRFHDLRHYYASALHAVGLRDQYIMKLGGWKSDAVLKSVYRGTLDDFEAEAADMALGYLEKSANKMLTMP